MDPAPLGLSQWDELGRMLGSLWIVVLLVVLAASNLLIGHNLVSSMVASQHISAIWGKTRPLFYGLGIASFAMALFFLAKVVDSAGVFRDFWPDYWI